MIVGLKLPPNCRRPQAGWSHHLPSSESRLSEVFEQPTTAEDFQGRNGNRELSPCTPFSLTMDHHTSNKRSNGSNTWSQPRTHSTLETRHSLTRSQFVSVPASIFPFGCNRHEMGDASKLSLSSTFPAGGNLPNPKGGTQYQNACVAGS